MMTLTEAQKHRIDEIREDRTTRLNEADRFSLRAIEQNRKDKLEWFKYKQDLRDIPTTFTLKDLTDVRTILAFEPAWPEEPTR